MKGRGRVRGRHGFTVLELVVVLVIGGILVTVVAASFGGVMDRISVRSAQTDYLSLHAQTRALAVERGLAIRLAANPSTGMVTVQVGCTGAGEVLQSRDFGNNHSVTLEAAGTVTVCMTPRGYADPEQNSFAGEAALAFVRGEHSQTVVLYPLGQAVRQ